MMPVGAIYAPVRCELSVMPNGDWYLEIRSGSSAVLAFTRGSRAVVLAAFAEYVDELKTKQLVQS